MRPSAGGAVRRTAPVVIALLTSIPLVVVSPGTASADDTYRITELATEAIVTLTESVPGVRGTASYGSGTCAYADSAGDSGTCSVVSADSTYGGAPCQLRDLAGRWIVHAEDGAVTLTFSADLTTAPGEVLGRYTTGDGAAGVVTGTMTATAQPGSCVAYTINGAVDLVPDTGPGKTGLRTVPIPEDAQYAADWVDPNVLAAKRAAVAYNSPQVAAWLAQNATSTTAPDDPCPVAGCVTATDLGCVPQPPPGVVNELPYPFCQADPKPAPPPAKWKASISGAQAQQKDYYCMPAAAAIILTSQGANPPSQDQLAAQMGTNPDTGTYMKNAVGPINNYRNTAAPHTPYVFSNATSPADLLDSVVTDTWTYRQDLIIGINMQTIGYYAPGTRWSPHVLVAYGYDTSRGGKIHVFDMYDGDMFGEPAADNRYGPHEVSIEQAWNSMAPTSGEMIW